MNSFLTPGLIIKSNDLQQHKATHSSLRLIFFSPSLSIFPNFSFSYLVPSKANLGFQSALQGLFFLDEPPRNISLGNK